MTKTDKIACVSESMTGNIWRRVYTDGIRLYIKYNGEIIDITENKKIHIMTE